LLVALQVLAELKEENDTPPKEKRHHKARGQGGLAMHLCSIYQEFASRGEPPLCGTPEGSSKKLPGECL